MTTTPAVLDLDAGRAERASARAAQREGTGDTLPIRFGGEQIAELPAEFPLNVLTPLKELGSDITYVIRGLLDAAKRQGLEQQVAILTFMADSLVAFPGLPAGLIKAAGEIGQRLLGEEGYAKFTAMNPTPWDIRALAAGILNWYGTSLGELGLSTASSQESGGETSKPTGSVTTRRTRGASGKSPARQVSSAPAVS